MTTAVPTFLEAAHRALASSLARPQTIAGYWNAVRGLESAIGYIPCDQLTPGHLLGALRAMRDRGLAPKTLANALCVARLILRDAGCARATDGVRVPKGPRRARALDARQVAALRSALDAGGAPEDVALAVILETGLRLGEALALDATDLHLPTHVRVRGTKTACAVRDVDLSRRAAALLRAAAVDAATSGAPLLRAEPRQLRRVLERRCREAGVPRVRVHDLRHTRLTLLLLAQVPPLYVSVQAGHAAPSYTMQAYGHAAAASSEDRRRWCSAV